MELRADRDIGKTPVYALPSAGTGRCASAFTASTLKQSNCEAVGR